MNQFWYMIGRLFAIVHDVREGLFEWRLPERSGSRGILGLLGRLATWLTIAYAATLVVVVVSIWLFAGRHWLVSALPFLPPFGWLLPLLVLLPLTLLSRPLSWLLPAQLACVLLVVGPYMGLEVSLSASVGQPDDRYVSIVSHNIGSNFDTSVAPFLTDHAPALVLLQEAGGLSDDREEALLGHYPYRVRKGEFLVASRFPIREANLIPDRFRELPIALRCIVDCWGQDIVVYNIHLPTRQHVYVPLRGLGILHADRRQQARQDLDQRQERTTELVNLLSTEPLPVIAAGDFNLPPHSALYDRYTDYLQDAFKVRGRGYGFSVPGTSRNPVGLYGPWVRIDYVMASQDVEVTGFVTEPKRRTQHLAIAATLRLPREE